MTIDFLNQGTVAQGLSYCTVAIFELASGAPIFFFAKLFANVCDYTVQHVATVKHSRLSDVNVPVPRRLFPAPLTLVLLAKIERRQPLSDSPSARSYRSLRSSSAFIKWVHIFMIGS